MELKKRRIFSLQDIAKISFNQSSTDAFLSSQFIFCNKLVPIRIVHYKVITYKYVPIIL